MEFNKSPDSINRGISMIMYGNPGVGKTTLATTLPVGETLIITCEAGVGPLLGTGHVFFDVLAAVDPEKNNIEEVIGHLYKLLRTEKHPFHNVVVDNLSELEQQLILNLTKKHGKNTPELREYGDSSYKMKEWVHLFRDLVFHQINVVFNAWEFPLEIRNTDGTVISKTFPMVGKKIAPQICGIVDVVGRLEANEKTQERRIKFRQEEQYITKSQFKGLSDIEPPDLVFVLSKLNAFNYKGEKDVNDELEKRNKK